MKGHIVRGTFLDFADVNSFLTFKLFSRERGCTIYFKLKCHRPHQPHFGELLQNSA